jgi:hypothetical protein
MIDGIYITMIYDFMIVAAQGFSAAPSELLEAEQ